MKLFTFVIPSYNSEQYLAGCLESLNIGVDDKIEAIVVNDGSTDKTSEIAHEYEKKYSFIKVVDKENGGHGSGINVGIDMAQGLYFKILDSDDHVDKEGLLNLISVMEKHLREGNAAELYLADYYGVPDDGSEKTITSLKDRVKKLNVVSDYSGFKKIKMSTYFMTHMLFIKTSVLKEYNVRLLEKCFYEDSLYTLQALMYCKTFCYVDKPVYLYTVGRAGQSVSLEKVSSNYAFQLRVAYACVNELSSDTLNSYDKYQKRVVRHEFSTLSGLTFFFLHIHLTKEKEKAYAEYIKFFKEKDLTLYKMIHHHSLMFWINLIPKKLRGWATNKVYDLLSKKYGWR